MKYTIEEAKFCNINPDELISFMRHSWKNAYPQFYQEDPNVLKRQFNRLQLLNDLNHPEVHIFIAYDLKNNIIGYSKCIMGKGSAEISKLYVSEQSQSQGVGKALLSKCFREIIESDLNRAFLIAYDKNINALQFYRNNGFKEKPIKTLYPSIGKNLYYGYRMECEDVSKQLVSLNEKTLARDKPLDSMFSLISRSA